MLKHSVIYLILSVCILSCSKNYFQQTNLSPAFSKVNRYSLILMKPKFITSKTINTDEALSRCMFHMKAELTKLNFDLLGVDKFEELIQARSFGGSGVVQEELALELAKKAGANTLAFTEISTESIQGGLPLMATIRIVNTADGSQLYMGKARADNPASLEAGLEFAIEKALEGLK
jgi:hypothetical protein